MSAPSGTVSYPSFEEDATLLSTTSEETSECSSDEGSQMTSYIDSDLQELYESFDVGDEISATLAAEGTVLPRATSRFVGFDEIPLYPEALLTAFQSNLLIFQYAIRHSLTTKAFTELLQLISVHVPRGAAVPKSVYQLKQTFLQTFPEAKAERHYYCERCSRPLPSADVPCVGDGCEGTSSAAFITVPLGPQVKKMMEG